jgi:anti-sigma B factor antagonist
LEQEEDALEHRIINSDRLEIAAEQGAAGEILRLRGRLNIDSSPEFRDRLLTTLRKGSREVVVDFAEVIYMDSSGLATLIEGLKVAHTCQSKLCVEGLQGRLLHLFEVTGVFSLFEASSCGAPSPALRRS